MGIYKKLNWIEAAQAIEAGKDLEYRNTAGYWHTVTKKNVAEHLTYRVIGEEEVSRSQVETLRKLNMNQKETIGRYQVDTQIMARAFEEYTKEINELVKKYSRH